MGNFAAKLAKMQENFAEGKKRAQEFGTEIPNGIYEGQLQTYKLEESRGESKRLQVRREILIDDGGSQDGNVSRDWRGIDTPVGMSFLLQNIAMHGYEMPETPAEIEDCVEAIENDAPRYRFQVSEKNGFKNIRILEIIDAGGEGAEEKDEAEGQTEAEPEAAEEEDETLVKVREFCDGQGVEYEADDDLDVLKEKIAEYEFYRDDCTQDQIDAMGFENSSPEEGISEDDDALLAEIGLGELVKTPPPIGKPKEKKVPKKSGAKKRR